MISKGEAAVALSEIERATHRSQTLRSYRIAGPILMLWGAIWIVGYVAMGLLPLRQWGLIWLPLDLIGVVSTLLLGRRRGATDAKVWRSVGATLAIMAFCVATLVVFRPSQPNVYLAFPGLVTGLIYAVLGIWARARFVWVGAAIFVASLIGFFLFPMGLAFWMAGVGGGGLVLGGLWIWRA